MRTVSGYHEDQRLSGAGRAAQSASAMIVLTLCLGCSHSLLGKIENGAVIGSKAWDFHSTNQAEARGGHEGNAIVGQSNLRQAFVSVAGASGIIALASLVERRDHQVLAHLIRSTAMVIWSAASLHNKRTK